MLVRRQQRSAAAVRPQGERGGQEKKRRVLPFADRGGSRQGLTARRLCSAEARTTTADLLT